MTRRSEIKFSREGSQPLLAKPRRGETVRRWCRFDRLVAQAQQTDVSSVLSSEPVDFVGEWLVSRYRCCSCRTAFLAEIMRMAFSLTSAADDAERILASMPPCLPGGLLQPDLTFPFSFGGSFYDCSRPTPQLWLPGFGIDTDPKG